MTAVAVNDTDAPDAPDDLPGGLQSEVVPKPPPANPLDLWAAEEFEGYPDADDYVCEALGICPGRPACLVAPAGSGKSWLLLDIALAVSDPSDYATCWGDKIVDRQGDVVYLDCEVGKKATWRRLQRLAYGRGKKLSDWKKRLLWRSYPKFSLTLKEAEDILLEVCAGKVLCCIDSLVRMLAGADENDASSGAYLAILARVSEATGCSFLLLHHEGKSDPNNPRAASQRGRGTSAFQGEWASQWALSKTDGVMLLEQGKLESGKEAEPFSLRLEDIGDRDPVLRCTPGIRLVPVSQEEAETLKEERKQARDDSQPMQKAMGSALAVLRARGPLPYGELREYMTGQTNLRKAAIEKLVEKGSILTKREGNRTLHFLPDQVGTGTSGSGYHSNTGTSGAGTTRRYGDDD